uniref:OCRE domain-containing protein n=1 Tax=Neolamprologus brichardi TaxID=32507 RepID=A0A3Q4MYP8_NEOBR
MGMPYFCAVPTTARSTCYRRTRPQGILHTASGSRASGPPLLTGRNTLMVTESQLCSVQQGLPSDLKVWNSWESNEGSEPQLTLQEKVFTFSSQPHSPKRGQGQGDQEKMEMGDRQVQSKIGRRYDVQPEDDFIGSESDEFTHTHKVPLSCHPGSPNVNLTPPLNTGMQPHSSGKAEPGLFPTRCFSPNGLEQKRGPRASEKVNRVLDVSSSISVCRRLLQEVISVLLVINLKAEEEDETLKPVDSSHCDLDLLSSPQTQDDEELRMLASLKREQEEDECKASGLSASQIHRCNVSISMSSDDTSTWTHISLVCIVHVMVCVVMSVCFYGLFPREWMDVLSPPIMPPSQQRRSGGDESVNEEENEDEYLNLLYDPCLNCYFDPKTGKYYELA